MHPGARTGGSDLRALLIASLLVGTAARGLADVPAIELVHPLVSLEGGSAVR